MLKCQGVGSEQRAQWAQFISDGLLCNAAYPSSFFIHGHRVRPGWSLLGNSRLARADLLPPGHHRAQRRGRDHGPRRHSSPTDCSHFSNYLKEELTDGGDFGERTTVGIRTPSRPMTNIQLKSESRWCHEEGRVPVDSCPPMAGFSLVSLLENCLLTCRMSNMLLTHHRKVVTRGSPFLWQNNHFHLVTKVHLHGTCCYSYPNSDRLTSAPMNGRY